MNDYLLFDLDGTLTDPKIGITTCVQYALASFGIEEPDLDKLEPFIGPPLKDSFMEFYGFDEQKAEQAVAKYRERFKDTGIFENKVYQGIPEMLKKLKEAGKRLAVASSKPTVFVERILEHFSIREYFDVVVGSELDGTRAEKPEIVATAMLKLYGNIPDYTGEKKKKTVMIGDRKFDVEGAKAAKITSVAVAYGYGSVEELEASGADHIVRNVEELERFLLRGTLKEEPKKESIWMLLWNVVVPVIMFYLCQSLGAVLGSMLLTSLAESLPRNIAEKLVYWNAEGVLEGTTANGSAIMSMFGFLIAAGVIWYVFAKDVIKKAKTNYVVQNTRVNKPLHYFCMVVCTLGLALGLNFLFEILGITDMSAAFQEVAEMQYAAALPLGLFVSGILAPVAEELVFRGVVFNRLRKSMKPLAAILMSACIFGVYHGNSVQGSYALLMGSVLAYLYENFGTFFVPLLAHIISNVSVYLLTMTGISEKLPINWWSTIGLLLIGIGALLICNKDSKPRKVSGTLK